MSEPTDRIDNPTELPSLAQLLARYLREPPARPEAGEVRPFDAVSAPAAEPRLAWTEALDAARFYGPVPGDLEGAAPPSWGALVADREPVMAAPFCLGNYPQLVRHFAPLVHTPRLSELRPKPRRAVAVAGLDDWAAQMTRADQYPHVLLAVAVFRLGRHYERANTLVRKYEPHAPQAWRAAWANERAAIAWHAGRADEAAALWNEQEATEPVLFNRGMAALFSDRAQDARPWLDQAVARLPEESPWFHLGKLYQAIAVMRA